MLHAVADAELLSADTLPMQGSMLSGCMPVMVWVQLVHVSQHHAR